MTLSRIRQEDEEEEARRRRRYPKPPPPGNGNDAEALARRLSVHRHGTHSCYCPNPDCGYTETVEEYVKCNTRSCPQCGTRMRASETGEYREITVDTNQPVGKTFLWSILAGAGLGLGFLIVRTIEGKYGKYDFATKKQLADKRAMEEASRHYKPPKKR